MCDRVVVILRGLGVALLLTLVLPRVAQAATLIVTNTNDSGAGSLRAALAASNSGDTIIFAPGLTGTITLTGGVLSISQSVNIAGPGAGSITINGNQSTTVFDIAPSVANQDVTISGLTITGGSATTDGGGILANDVLHSLTLTGDTITGNQVTLSSTSAGGGAGVYVNGGTLTVLNSSITNNTVTLTGSATTTDGGGGMYDNGGSVTVAGSDVSGNSVDQAASFSSSGGGGIYSNGGDIDVSTSTVRNNTDTVHAGQGGSDGGGGIYSNGGAVSLANATVDANTFTLGTTTIGDNGGGGVYSAGGNVGMSASTIDGNSTTLTDNSQGADGGGGLFSEGGTVTVVGSSISSNTGNVTGNPGDKGGGGVLDEGNNGTYLNSTLSANSMTINDTGSTSDGGGAIFTFGGDTASDVTIAGNTINRPGGGILNTTGTFELKNSIIADNTATPAGNCAGFGTFTSGGFNLESANTCGLNATGDLVNTQPKLGPLQDNGGPTPTQALPAGSPAVDAGSCTDILGDPVPSDQRGVARPQPAGGRCDIGAYELVPSSGGSGGGGPTPPPSAPAATPSAPAATSSTAATFSGTVNPEGQVTTVFFQYGIDSRYRPGGGTAVIYDQTTPAQTLPADSIAHAVSASASGLVPNALYHERLVAQNSAGTTFGADQTFTTPAAPAPPPPVLGRTVNVKPVSGQVFVLVGTTLVPLTEGQQLPSGAIVDARAGSLQLTAAEGPHKHETGVFGGAIFKVTQSHASLTTLSLVEGALAGGPSYATCKAHKGADPSATAASTSTLQLLHASAHGKFRTSGRYAAATVRGTKWTIADRCDGTVTHDITDSVAVNDFARHKTIILHAGQSYLAKARRK